MASSEPDKDITGEILCPDVLLKVFLYLSTSDLLSAAQVCKEWRNAVDCKTSWRGRRFNIDLMREFEEHFIFTFEQREIEHLCLVAPNSQKISLAQIAERIRAIMRCFSPNLRELKIQNRRLSKTDVDVVFSDKIECLEKLEFWGVYDAAGRGLVRVSEQCPKLQHLKPHVDIPAPLIRTLGTNLPSLRTLSLGSTNTYDNGAMKDIRSYMPNLESVSLHPSLINDEGISQLAIMRRLMSLELTFCFFVTAEAIKFLGQAKSPLQRLILMRCLYMDPDLVLNNIGEYSLGIKELQILDSNKKVTDAGFRGLITNAPSPLEKVCISNTRLSKPAILDVIKNSPNLLRMKLHEREVNIPETIHQQKLQWK